VSDSSVRAPIQPIQPIHEGREAASTRVFGYWAYIMSDCVLFGTLFATYAVLSRSYAGGPTGKQLFELRGVLIETFCLLASSFTYGLASLAVHRGRRFPVIGLLALTFALGAAFVGLEAREFAGLIAAGNGPQRSGFLSAFFTLVGTHGLHVTSGLIWMAALAVQIAVKGLTPTTSTRVMSLGLFWHFLDVVWICVFTFVYLMGAL
jgi:cytochrome o ubiquinol oxidase subunit 3